MIKALLARLAGRPYTLIVDRPIDDIAAMTEHQAQDAAQAHNGRVWAMVTDLGHKPWSLAVAIRLHGITASTVLYLADDRAADRLLAAVTAQVPDDTAVTLLFGNRLTGRVATRITTPAGPMRLLR